MKRAIPGIAILLLVSLPLLAALKVGEKAPDFSGRGSLAGKEFNFSLADALKKGPAVVYFYPSAYTQGCDAEAHAFAREQGADRIRERHQQTEDGHDDEVVVNRRHR